MHITSKCEFQTIDIDWFYENKKQKLNFTIMENIII